jgi:putative tricarboxylic transport membrane protein
MFFLMYFAIRHIAKLVLVPKYVLYPIILMMSVVGAYTINYGVMTDVWTLLVFGILAFLGEKFGLNVACFVIGFILGPSAEIYFVKSLESFGTLTIFFTKSPIAMLLWVLIAGSVALSVYFARKSRPA